VINCSLAFQQHAQTSISPSLPLPPLSPPPSLTLLTSPTLPPSILSFSKAIEIIINVLYIREKERKSTIYSFDEFHVIMKGKDAKLKFFFDELYFSSNPFSKNKDSWI